MTLGMVKVISPKSIVERTDMRSALITHVLALVSRKPPVMDR